MLQQKTLAKRIFKLLLFVPLVFVFLLPVNAQSENVPSAISTDSLKKIKPDMQQPDKDWVYEEVEKKPQFPGGENVLLNHIGRHLRYPNLSQERGIQGTIIVRFVVDKSGKVRDATILKGLDSAINKEGLRVVSTLPDWTPGEQKGEKVSVYYVLPIKFKLHGTPPAKPVCILDDKLLPRKFDLGTLNKDSIHSVFVIKPGETEKLSKIGEKYKTDISGGVFILISKEYARRKALEKVESADDEKLKDVGEEIPQASSSENTTTNGLVYDVVQKMPQFPGGDKALKDYIARNLKYPDEARTKGIKGIVIVRFVISKSGETTRVEVLRGVSTELDKEAVRVIESLPDWVPGMQNEVKVSVYYTLPIKFM